MNRALFQRASSLFFGLVPDRSTWATLACSACGGAIGNALGIPAGWLSGAMLGGILAIALLRLKPKVPLNLITIDFVLLGLIMGSTVTPETLHLMKQWPGPIMGLLICVLAIMASATLYLRHIEGWEKTTAFLASVPGGLSTLLAFAVDMKADVRPIAFVQTLRLAFLVVLLPLPFSAMTKRASPSFVPVAPAEALRDYAFLLLGALIMIAIARRLRLPGGPIVASMMASGLLYGANIVHAHLPPWLLAACMIVLGAMMAERFIGTTWADFRRMFRASLGVLAAGMVISALFALVVAQLTGISFGGVLLAYAPGGVEAMAILAYALGLDPAFVAAMHLMRFLFIAVGLPIMVRLVLGKPADQ